MQRLKLEKCAWLTPYNVITGLSALVFTLIWVRNAWMSDDAYITLRTVHNFLHAFGPVFNPGERVQTYTHPLWFLLLIPAYAITGEGYYSTLALSWLVSLATLVVFVKFLARTTIQALFGVGVMLLSRAFIDYTSSGLENPLSSLTLALLFVAYWNPVRTLWRLFWASLAASLVTLTRPDLILLAALPLCLVLLQTWKALVGQRRRALAVLAAGFLPLALWLMFSLVYYGMLVPNTLYAKTPANVSLETWIRQGGNYFVHSLAADPLTLSVIALAVVLAVRSRAAPFRTMAIGICLYLAYIVWVGGDFMNGRFFTAPLFLAVVILGRVEALADLRILVPVAIAAFVLGFLASPPTLLSDERFGVTTDAERVALTGADRINDQRAFYYHWTGLLRNLTGPANLESISEVQDGLKAQSQPYPILRTTGLGLRSYYAGPTRYAVDEYAIADPFLAWLPRQEGWWLPGHFSRCVPLGYAAALNLKVLKRKEASGGRRQLTDPKLRELYDAVFLITRGSLMDSKRWAAILQFNSGAFQALRRHDYPCENFWSGKSAPENHVAQ